MIDKFSDEFKSFIIQNNILTTISAVVIAFSAGIFIRSLVGDIVLPALYTFIFSKFNVFGDAFAPLSWGKFDNFIKELISFLLVIVCTFFIIVYVIKKIVYIEKPIVAQQTVAIAAPAPQQIVVDEKKNNNNNNMVASTITEGFQKNYYAHAYAPVAY